MTKFRARRAENKLVGHRWLLKTAREIFSKVYPEYPTAFTFSQGWLQGFLKRNGVSWIRITRQATKLPADYERYIKNFLRRIRRVSATSLGGPENDAREKTIQQPLPTAKLKPATCHFTGSA